MFIIVLVTAKDKKEALKISRKLIVSKLAACVNIIEKVDSLFIWKAKIEHSKESLLVIKSKKVKLDKIIRLVKSMHSYEVPEIIALPVIGGDKQYLRWVDESLR